MLSASARAEPFAGHASFCMKRQRRSNRQRQNRSQCGVDAQTDRVEVLIPGYGWRLNGVTQAGGNQRAGPRVAIVEPTAIFGSQARALLNRADDNIAGMGIQHQLQDTQ